MSLDALIIAIVTGAASGLVSWGAMRMQLAWLRRDVDGLRSAIYEGDNPANLQRRVSNIEGKMEVLQAR